MGTFKSAAIENEISRDRKMRLRDGLTPTVGG